MGGMAQDGADEREPDYRFTLANERTFLAWIRTALALLAGAVAVFSLVPLAWGAGLRTSVGLALAALSIVIAGYAPYRWIRVQRAMRRDAPLPVSLLPVVTSLTVLVVCGFVIAGNLSG